MAAVSLGVGVSMHSYPKLTKDVKRNGMGLQLEPFISTGDRIWYNKTAKRQGEILKKTSDTETESSSEGECQ